MHNGIRKFALFILLTFLLMGILPAPAAEAAPPIAPSSLAHKTEAVFWSDIVPIEKPDGSDWLTFTSGGLHMEMAADKTKCTVTPLLIYWKGNLVGDLRCEKYVWKRGGQWIPEIHELYGNLPPDQQ